MPRKTEPHTHAIDLEFEREFLRHIPFVLRNCKDVKDKAPPTYPSAKARLEALGKAVVEAGRNLEELQANAAAGDQGALNMLVEFMNDTIGWLEGLSYRKPELMRQVARPKTQWPMIWHDHTQRLKDLRKYAKRIQLGEGETSCSKSKNWGVGWGGRWSEATVWAVGIQATILGNQRRLGYVKILRQHPAWKKAWAAIPQWSKDCLTLPPLTKDTAAQWFEIGWQAILEKTNGRPEDVPELRKLGEHCAKKSERSEQQKKATPRTADANIRTRIKERIAQALHSMASNPSR